MDIEILEADHTWNLRQVSGNQVKVSVRLPASERNYLYDDPANSSTEFAKGPSILPGQPMVLLKLEYGYRNGEKRELTVDAEIRSKDQAL